MKPTPLIALLTIAMTVLVLTGCDSEEGPDPRFVGHWTVDTTRAFEGMEMLGVERAGAQAEIDGTQFTIRVNPDHTMVAQGSHLGADGNHTGSIQGVAQTSENTFSITSTDEGGNVMPLEVTFEDDNTWTTRSLGRDYLMVFRRQ